MGKKSDFEIRLSKSKNACVLSCTPSVVSPPYTTHWGNVPAGNYEKNTYEHAVYDLQEKIKAELQPKDCICEK